MALKTFVLISTVNNLSDARYCAGMDVDLIGFSMEENNKNYISPETFQELTEWLSGVEFVGEFNGNDIEVIEETLKLYNTSYVQISDPQMVSPLKKLGFTVLLRLPISSAEAIIDAPDYLILESDHKEISTTQHHKIQRLTSNHKVLLGFGLNDQNVEALLEKTQAHGIALRGGDEIKPGYKDYDELADILEALEIDDMAD